MFSYLVDTHALIFWLLEPRKLSRAAVRHLSDSQQAFHVSVMTLLEITFLNEIGKITVKPEEVSDWILGQERWQVAAFDASILAHAKHVGTRDPFDRVLVATALAHDWRFLTKDDWIRTTYPKLAVW